MLTTLVIFLLAAAGTGMILCKLLRLEWRNKPMMFLVNITIGIDLLALFSLLGGWFKVLSPLTIWIFMGSMAIYALAYSSKTLYPLWHFINKNRFFTVIAGLLFLFTLGSSLCYPYCWDELTYHVALPERWIRSGDVAVFADNPYSAFPSLPHLVFRLAMECGGIKIPRMLCWVTYLIFFTGTYMLIKPYGARWKTLICICVFMFSPIFIVMMREAYVEPFLLINLLGVFLTLKGTINSNRYFYNIFIVCGIFAGAAAAVKLTGLGVAGIILIIAASYPLIDLRYRILCTLASLLPTAILFCLPFYLRPLLATGNPFYPFFATFFTADASVIAMSEYHYAMGDYHYGIKNLNGFFTAPILLCFYDKIFDGIVLGWQFLFLCLSALMVIIFYLRTNCSMRNFGIISAIIFFYFFWFFSSQQSRFVIPLFFLIFLIGCKPFFRIDERWKLFILTSVLIISTMTNSMWVDIRHYYISWRWVFGATSWTTKFLEIGTRDKGYINAMGALAEKTQNNANIMLIFERRGLYCPRKYIIATPFYQAKFFTPVPEKPSDVFKILCTEKVDYIMVGSSLVNPDHLENYNRDNLELARRLAGLIGTKTLELIWSDDGYNLFKVKRQ
jgi:hypothetical protein